MGDEYRHCDACGAMVSTDAPYLTDGGGNPVCPDCHAEADRLPHEQGVGKDGGQ
jgi:predicted CXXCH cytochrome family protein